MKIVLGHIGEGIPIYLWRIDNRNGWMKAPHKYPAKQSVAHYFRKHFHLTTSGNFDTHALVNAMSVMGADRVMFSVDWPFEDIGEGAEWFDKAAISEADRAKVGRDNAIKLFRLAAALISACDSARPLCYPTPCRCPGAMAPTAWPSTIASGSSTSTFAQSTYSRK